MKRSGSWLTLVAVSLLVPAALHAEQKTIVGFARAEARSSTWISVEAPFLGDDNENGYTRFGIGRSPEGPFALTSSLPAAGPSGWRGEFIPRLTPDTEYYIQVEYFDPVDGVIEGTGGIVGPGRRVQVLGPIRTLASAPLSVRVEPAIADVRTNEILVSVPISDDANANSGATFEIAEDLPGVPDSGLTWSRRCGPSGSVHPKLCRIRSLTPGRTYRIRVNVTDLNGVTGSANQVIRGIRYTGGENVAFGRPVTVSSPGWGCCSNPAALTDGRIQYEDWTFGFAFPGGTSCHGGGCPAGDNKSATIDLGRLAPINRVVVWFHDAQTVARSWAIETSTDGLRFNPVYGSSDPRCRADSFPLRTDWSFPACAHTASFAPVDARYVRYRFDDTTLFSGLHGFLLELEVFQSGELTAAPARREFLNQPVGTVSAEQTFTFRNTGLTPVTLQAPRVTPPGLFSIANRCPNVLNVNTWCEVAVTFEGARNSLTSPAVAALSIDHDGAGGSTVVQLHGTSVTQTRPTISVSQTSLRFPAVSVGASTAEQRINVTNTGTASATLTFSLPGSSFPVRNTCRSTLPAGEFCAVYVRFRPTSATSFSNTMTVTWTGGGSQAVTLSGSALADTDEDGIPDDWERGEVTVLGERINLANMGAQVGVKDVFVELDYLEDAGHTHKPKREAIRKVVEAFRLRNIALHVDCGPDCVMTAVDENPENDRLWGTASRSDAVPHMDPITNSTTEIGFRDRGGYSWTSFDQIKTRYLSPARSVIFRYGIFAHNLGGAVGTTGLARTQTQDDRSTASDFIVSLGATANVVGNVFEQAGTFMHELGHNLGLMHGGCTVVGGEVTCERGAYKPNYLSVMNYLFQTRGLFRSGLDGVIDYADSPTVDLDKSSLDEVAGLGPLAGSSGTRYWCAVTGERPVLQAARNIDWNCDGTIQRGTRVAAEIDGLRGGTPLVKTGSDWPHLVYTGGSVGQAGAPAPEPEVTPIEELTVEEDQEITTVFGVSVATGDALRVRPGSSGSVTLTIQNRGSSPDTFRLTVTPSLQVSGWINAASVPAQISLASGATRTFTIPVAAPPTGGAGEVALRADSIGNPAVFDVGRVEINSGLADVVIGVTPAPDPLLLGNRLVYSVVVQNAGQDTAQNVLIHGDLPTSVGPIAFGGGVICLGTANVVCSLGDLAPNQRVTLSITTTPQAVGILRATFRVSSSTSDPSSTNDVSITTTAVLGRPVLAANITRQQRSGAELRLELTFRNTGTEPATAATITGVTARALAGSGNISVVSPAVPVALGPIAPGATVVLPLTLTVPATVTRLTLSETGAVRDARGSSYSFSLAQAVTP